MFQIAIHNEQSHVAVDEALLADVAERTLRLEGIADAEIGIALVDDAAIRELNRRFLQHDAATDVLSFRLDGDGTPQAVSTAGLEGEIVLSGETAARRAAEFGWSGREEVVLYLVHGLLHLAGYDDQSDDDRAVMRSRERAALARFHLTPRYDSGEESPAADDSNPARDSSSCTGGLS